MAELSGRSHGGFRGRSVFVRFPCFVELKRIYFPSCSEAPELGSHLTRQSSQVLRSHSSISWNIARWMLALETLILHVNSNAGNVVRMRMVALESSNKSGGGRGRRKMSSMQIALGGGRGWWSNWSIPGPQLWFFSIALASLSGVNGAYII